MKTVRDEIKRLFDLSQNPNWSRYNCSSEAGYYYTLCEVKNKDMSLDDFYKEYPFYNPDINSDYWQQQHKKWKEIWNELN